MIPSANNFLVSGLRHQIYHSPLLFSFPAYYKQIRDTVTKKQDYLGIFPQIRDKVTKKRDYLGIIPTTLNIRGNPQPLSPQVPSKVRPRSSVYIQALMLLQKILSVKMLR